MLYPETYNVFKKSNRGSISNALNAASNGTDCILNGCVPDSYVSSLRSNFGLHVDEEILMFRDTSFWDSEDQGTVVTDWGITFIPDNNKTDDMIQMTWENIHHVERKGDQLIFFHSESRNDNTPVHLNFFVKDTDQYNRTGRALAELFTKMAESQKKVTAEEAYEYTVNQARELEEKGKTDEALQLYLDFRNDFNNAVVTDDIVRILAFQKHDYSRAIKILDEDIQGMTTEEQKELKSALTWWKNKTLEFQELNRLRQIDNTGKMADEACERHFDYLLAEHRDSYFFVAQNATDDTTGGCNPTKIKQDSANDFILAENYLQEHFLERPYKDRKLIVPVETYTALDQKTLTAIDINRLGMINFPMGHPIANHLYVGHPLIPSKYIPFEDYELELIEDRVREYCVLAQALGATSITIQCVNENNSRGSQRRTENLDSAVSYGVDVQGSTGVESNSEFLNKISRRINLHQEFSPIEKPHVPEGLVWYSQEPSWQRLTDQRMKGTLNVQDEFIESRKSQVVENSELQRISAEVEFLWVYANGSWDESMKQMFEKHENATLAIHVEFAPIETLGANRVQAVSQTTKLTEDEQEYVDELKECLADDGAISDKERRLLNKFRLRLGISEARAQELENALKPQLQLTSDEQEYLTEYKDALADGELTATSRRLLNKIRASLNISEERASEIENSIK